MNPTNRKLGEPIPVRLILTPQGTLKMHDGSDVSEYLKLVRRSWKVRGNLPVCITPRDSTEELEFQALMYRNRGA